MIMNIADEKEPLYPPIIDLAEYVNKAWQDSYFDYALFPEIAANALKIFKNYDAINPEKIAQWLLSNTTLPEQLQKTVVGAFGDPPVTLYSADHFVIDVYFWLTKNVTIHDHAFCGAFTLVQGSTLQTCYRFEEEGMSEDEDIKWGKLIRTQVELLTPSSRIIKILSGNQFIHYTSHLEYPTITLCIRTKMYPQITQLNYYFPSIAVKTKKNKQDSLYLSLLPLLSTQSIIELKNIISLLILKKKSLLAMHALFYFADLVRNPNEIKIILDLFQARYPELTNSVTNVISQILHCNAIYDTKAQNLHSKIICEIIKSSHSKKELLSAVSKLYPNKSAENLFSQWLDIASQEGAITSSLSMLLRRSTADEINHLIAN